MPKVLTLSKCFKSPAVFATTFCFADAKRIIWLLLIVARCCQGTLFLVVNKNSTTQFDQTNQVIPRKKLINQLIWNGALLKEVTKYQQLINESNRTKIRWKQEELWPLDKVRNVLIKKKTKSSHEGDIKTAQHHILWKK